jgi:hypothetical protein
MNGPPAQARSRPEPDPKTEARQVPWDGHGQNFLGPKNLGFFGPAWHVKCSGLLFSICIWPYIGLGCAKVAPQAASMETSGGVSGCAGLHKPSRLLPLPRTAIAVRVVAQPSPRPSLRRHTEEPAAARPSLRWRAEEPVRRPNPLPPLHHLQIRRPRGAGREGMGKRSGLRSWRSTRSLRRARLAALPMVNDIGVGRRGREEERWE